MSGGGDWCESPRRECASLAQRVSNCSHALGCFCTYSGLDWLDWRLGWAGLRWDLQQWPGKGEWTVFPRAGSCYGWCYLSSAQVLPIRTAPGRIHNDSQGARVQAQALDRSSRKWFKINKIWNAPLLARVRLDPFWGAHKQRP